MSELTIVTGGRHQQDPLPAAVLVVDLFQRVQVEDGLLDRHRDDVGDLEGQRLAQLRKRHPRQVELADDHLLVGDADDDLLGGELHPRPELPDGGGHGFAVDDFAVAHGARREGDLPEALQRRLVFRPSDLSRADARRPDVEADGSASRHSSPFPTRESARDGPSSDDSADRPSALRDGGRNSRPATGATAMPAVTGGFSASGLLGPTT